ncbi:MAG: FAD/NAD(P)-binding protein [Planctomycetaceae bacterium]|nr:FAD/NAD(P)-binding protein [Planctomycetaceae bacterium]
MRTVACPSQVVDPWLAHTVRIVSITDEVEGVATYHLEFADADTADSYSFLPGQFNMLYLPGVGEAAISISSDPSAQGTLDHTVRIAGNVTGELARTDVGSTFGLRGPFGSSWPIDDCAGGDVVIVTGGIGLAPLRPAIYEFLNRKSEFGHITLLYGARNPFGMLYTSEYDDWQLRGLNVNTTVDRSSQAWQGNVGVVTQLLDRMPVPDPKKTSVLCCGPEVMMWYTARSALGRRIPKDRIWVSLERNMNCAIGLCGHCQFGPTFVCKDGPVIRYDRVASLLKVEGF